MKNIYFLSDAHLGSLAIEHRRTQERRLVNFLDSIKHKAEAVYLLGDMFDFWHEYRTVVPKGYTRLLGKISELTDLGVEVHYFYGNHDLWQNDYFEKECGMTIHRKEEVVELYGKTFFLAHGDGLGTTTESVRTSSPPSTPAGEWRSDLNGHAALASNAQTGKSHPIKEKRTKRSSASPRNISKLTPTSTSFSSDTDTLNWTSCSDAKHVCSSSAIGFLSSPTPCLTEKTCSSKPSSKAKAIREKGCSKN